MIKLIACFPVQSGTGFRMAGMGISPSNLSFSICVTSCMNCSFVRNVSLRVNKLMPMRPSCTIPITGLFCLGAVICLGTWQMFISSALVS